jgi:hypothetical protein
MATIPPSRYKARYKQIATDAPAIAASIADKRKTKACKITVAPWVATGPRAVSKAAYPVSQRGWVDAVEHARKGDATIFLVCARGEIRLADCSETNFKNHGMSCRLGIGLGGRSTRVIAGHRKTRRHK